MLGFRGRGAGVQTLGPAARRSGGRSEDADGARTVQESPPTQPPEMDIAMDPAVLGFCSPVLFPLFFPRFVLSVGRCPLVDWAEELSWNLEGSWNGCVGARWHVGPQWDLAVEPACHRPMRTA